MLLVSSLRREILIVFSCLLGWNHIFLWRYDILLMEDPLLYLLLRALRCAPEECGILLGYMLRLQLHWIILLSRIFFVQNSVF